MIFTEFRFLAFFVVVYVLYWTLKSNRSRLWLLLISSYFFYGAWDWRFLGLLLYSTLLDYFVGRGLEKYSAAKARRLLLLTSMAGNLGLLCVFKYLDWFISEGVSFLGFLGIPASYTALSLILPVGISFYTFQTMSYTIDVYQKKLEVRKDLLKFAVFVVFFPQLVAGPIVRASSFLPQLDTIKNFGDIRIRKWVTLFLIGYIKKACIADNIAPFVDLFYDNPQNFDVLSGWLAAFCFAVQIYCDFSGYTDMAWATAGLLGYELTPNFNFPYFAPNVAEYWRRWHISLGSFLFDYVYFPLELRVLGAARRSKTIRLLRGYFNLMFTFFLVGLWHGASWTFVLWGLMHGVAMVVYREWRRWGVRFAPIRTVVKYVGAPSMFIYVVLSLVIFRATNLANATEAYKTLFFPSALGLEHLQPWLFPLLVGLAGIHLLEYKKHLSTKFSNLSQGLFVSGVVAGGLVAYFLTPEEAAPFVYFQF